MKRNPADGQRREMIAEFGWTVMLVADSPPFGYTVGISSAFGQPELFICGLDHEDIHWICNRYGEQVREGKAFAAGDSVSGWLDGSEMLLIEVADEWKPEFMGKAVDDLGERVPALQAVWPVKGDYPWDEGWPEQLEEAQFLIGNQQMNKHDAPPEINEIIHEKPVWRQKQNFIFAVELPPGCQWDTEQLWGKKLGNYEFELLCIPFAAPGLGLGDRCRTDDQYFMREIVMDAGRAVFQARVPRQQDMRKLKSQLSALKVLFEVGEGGSVAVDAPDEATCDRVLALLSEAKALGTLEFERSK
jgi:hypothetical protein